MTNVLLIIFAMSLIYLSIANRLMSYVKILAFQGIILFWVSFIELGEMDPFNLTFILLETIVFKTIAVPLFLKYVIQKNEITREAEHYLSNHIDVTWVFVELTTLSASALIYHRRNVRTLEGTWKYIFVCSISIAFVFIGILFLSIAVQEVGDNNLTFTSLIRRASEFDVFWLRLSFIFIFTGYTAKIGLVPMFTAGIDAKDKAPSPAGALISSVILNVGFVGIFRFYEILAQTTLFSWANNIIMI